MLLNTSLARRSFALLAGTALFLTGCGSDGTSASPTTTATSASTETTTPATSVPETAAPETTVVETAAPETTVPETTVPETTLPGRVALDDQMAPGSINGIEVVGDSIWVASIAGNQVLEIDRTSGAILTRALVGEAGPDDVTLGPDGYVYWTGFGDGSIGRIVEGTSEVINTLEPGANPLGFTSDGELIVGLALTADGLFRVPVDGSAPETIARDLGDLNAFAIVDDVVYGPVGGIQGPGVVVAIDLATGETRTVAEGLPAVTASTLGPDGLLYVLSGVTGQVFTVDLESGESSEVHQLTDGFWDNLSFAVDGTLYVSSFVAPVIVVIAPDGSMTSLAIGDFVAS